MVGKHVKMKRCGEGKEASLGKGYYMVGKHCLMQNGMHKGMSKLHMGR